MLDLLIKNAWIIDGTGKTKFKGNIGIVDDRIVQIGQIPDDSNAQIINAEGYTITPGFIDPHAHFDLLFEYFPQCENALLQGITTFVGGNCGMSSVLTPPSQFNFREFLTRIEKLKLGINFVPLIGHGYIRGNIMGDNFARSATPSEIEQMKTLTITAMENGAFGLSTGLDYNPTMHATTQEIIELAKIVANYEGIYATHHRFLQSKWPAEDPNETSYTNYPGKVEEVWFGRYHGLLEAFEIGRKAQIPVQISHLYNVYRTPQPHPKFLDIATTKATLALIDQALSEGIDVAFDRMVTFREIQGSKPIINDFLNSDNPSLAHLKKLDRTEFLAKLHDAEFRSQIKDLSNSGKLKILYSNTRADPFWMHRMLIIHCSKEKYVEKTIGEIAQSEHKDALDVIFDLMILDEHVEYQQFMDEKEITEENLPLYLNHPNCMPCTDLIAYPSISTPIAELDPRIRKDLIQNINSPHSYDMYPYYLGTFIRDRKIMPLEIAIQKATSLVAHRFGIRNRGEIKVGYFADLVIFDYEKIGRASTYRNPRVPPEGIEYVIVNGKIALQNNQPKSSRFGKIIRKNQQ